jgi:sugar transferase (PEP-CTERM/EpsH1 system associated)
MHNTKKKKLTVAQVVNSLEVGGLEKVVVNLINHVDKDFFDPLLFCLRDGGALVGDAHCGVETFGKTEGFSFTLPFRLARSFRRHKVDIVHCHNFGPVVYGAGAARLAGAPRVIYTIHGRATSGRRKQRMLERMGWIDRVVPVSEDARKIVLRNSRLAPEKVRTIINGIDVALFERDIDRRTMRNELGVPDDAAVFGIVARLTAAKDHHVLFEAFARLVERAPGAVLLVVGDGERAAELHALVQRLAVHDRIKFLGQRHDIPEILGALDAFVLSSHSEGLSVTLLEAMAAGLPIIATRVGGNTEVVLADETGLIVPPMDPAALETAMMRLIDHPESGRKMGLKGRERVKERFSVDKMVCEYQALYSEVADIHHR